MVGASRGWCPWGPTVSGTGRAGGKGFPAFLDRVPIYTPLSTPTHPQAGPHYPMPAPQRHTGQRSPSRLLTLSLVSQPPGWAPYPPSTPPVSEAPLGSHCHRYSPSSNCPIRGTCPPTHTHQSVQASRREGPASRSLSKFSSSCWAPGTVLGSAPRLPFPWPPASPPSLSLVSVPGGLTSSPCPCVPALPRVPSGALCSPLSTHSSW